MASLPWLPFPYTPYFPRFSRAYVLACVLKVMLHGTGRDESQGRFLVAHHSVGMLERYCMLLRCITQKILVAKSSHVTSPLVLHEWWSKVIYSIQLL